MHHRPATPEESRAFVALLEHAKSTAIERERCAAEIVEIEGKLRAAYPLLWPETKRGA